MSNLLIFLHVAAVLWFIGAHGASMSMLFRLRKERDPARIDSLLQFSATSTRSMYASLIAVVVTGVAAGINGHWWGFGWIWAALGVLIATTGVMQVLAKPYYRRVGTIARAMSGGSQAVTPEQFDAVLRERRPLDVLGVGALALGVILYLMIFKPTLGLQPSATPIPVITASGGGPPCSPSGTTVNVSGHDFGFDQRCLAAPANTPFQIVFNDTAGTHNVAIYMNLQNGKVLFRGDIVTGPRSTTYSVGALPAGTYAFRCDVHPTLMTGVFVVAAP